MTVPRVADPVRLAAVRATELLRGPRSPVLQTVARLASRTARAPALVSLLDDRREFFVAKAGPLTEPYASQREIPLGRSLAVPVVVNAEPLMIRDVRNWAPRGDVRAVAAPRAFLGVPLLDADDQPVGCLSAIDGTPRVWSRSELLAMADLAALAQNELRHARARSADTLLAGRLHAEARRDVLTDLPNRRHWHEQAPVTLSLAQRDDRPLSAIMLDLDGFKALNDALGHAEGDARLSEIGRRWRTIVRTPDIIVRWGGDEFAALILGADAAIAAQVAQRLVRATADIISISVGVAEWDRFEDVASLLDRADHAMFAAKRHQGRPKAGDGPPEAAR